MGVRRAVSVVMLGLAAMTSLVVADDYLLTPKMLGNFNPETGIVLSSGTPSGKKNVGYQAFDRKKCNQVPMSCAANQGCQPIELIFSFTGPTKFVRCKNYKLYVASDIAEEQKPVNWTLSCTVGDYHPWNLLDTVVNFDWSTTEVYQTDLSEHPRCMSYLLTMTNPVDSEGRMTTTISELMLYGVDA